MTIFWQASNNFPNLSLPGEVHIWCADLRLDTAQRDWFWGLLSEEEKKRVERFKFDIHRNRFIAAKGILRTLLGSYLKIPPTEIDFILGPHGKPYLPPEISQNVFFNSSDSQDLALYAFNFNNEIGIDIEFLRDNLEPLPLAERFFSSYENKVLIQLPEEQKKIAFFNCWTRKEAVIKAMGKGLSFQLDKFDVSLAPGTPAKLIRIEGEEFVEQWFLHHLEPATNYVAALAIKQETETPEIHLRCFRFP